MFGIISALITLTTGVVRGIQNYSDTAYGKKKGWDEYLRGDNVTHTYWDGDRNQRDLFSNRKVTPTRTYDGRLVIKDDETGKIIRDLYEEEQYWKVNEQRKQGEDVRAVLLWESARLRHEWNERYGELQPYYKRKHLPSRDGEPWHTMKIYKHIKTGKWCYIERFFQGLDSKSDIYKVFAEKVSFHWCDFYKDIFTGLILDPVPDNGKIHYPHKIIKKNGEKIYELMNEAELAELIQIYNNLIISGKLKWEPLGWEILFA